MPSAWNALQLVEPQPIRLTSPEEAVEHDFVPQRPAPVPMTRSQSQPVIRYRLSKELDAPPPVPSLPSPSNVAKHRRYSSSSHVNLEEDDLTDRFIPQRAAPLPPNVAAPTSPTTPRSSPDLKVKGPAPTADSKTKVAVASQSSKAKAPAAITVTTAPSPLTAPSPPTNPLDDLSVELAKLRVSLFDPEKEVATLYRKYQEIWGRSLNPQLLGLHPASPRRSSVAKIFRSRKVSLRSDDLANEERLAAVTMQLTAVKELLNERIKWDAVQTKRALMMGGMLSMPTQTAPPRPRRPSVAAALAAADQPISHHRRTASRTPSPFNSDGDETEVLTPRGSVATRSGSHSGSLHARSMTIEEEDITPTEAEAESPPAYARRRSEEDKHVRKRPPQIRVPPRTRSFHTAGTKPRIEEDRPTVRFQEEVRIERTVSQRYPGVPGMPAHLMERSDRGDGLVKPGMRCMP